MSSIIYIGRGQYSLEQYALIEGRISYYSLYWWRVVDLKTLCIDRGDCNSLQCVLIEDNTV